MDAVELRLYRKALSNELAIAIGSSLSDPRFALPSLAEEIKKRFDVSFDVQHPLDYYHRWNEFVDAAEKQAKRAAISAFTSEYLRDAQPRPIHHALARVPISNFIDTTFDRSFVKALTAAGRKPLFHDWDQQMMGSWRQTKPETPNVFFMLPKPDPANPWWGIHELTTKGNNIQISNIADMLDGRDLLMLDFFPGEADWVLNLPSLVTSGEKIINYTERFTDDRYWNSRGVLVRIAHPDAIAERLAPSQPRGQRYGVMDTIAPRGSLLDVMRSKRYDAFMSYFTGDAAFARRLEKDLQLRDLTLWRDDHEIEIGDSLSAKIEEGLLNSYSMLVVLSPEALARRWVTEELRAAYARRLADDFKIFPVLHKDCILPPFLADYRYADFRDDRRYEESLALLERAIKNAVRRAQEKK